MAQPARRARASCSPELAAVVAFVGRFSDDDLALARALMDNSFSIGIAARTISTSPENARQRLCTLVARIRKYLPGYEFRSGAKPNSYSYDQSESLMGGISKRGW